MEERRTETTNATNIIRLPLAFVRSDAIRVNDGNVGYTGYRGYGWSRTARSSTVAYNLYMYPTLVDPSYDWYRYGGLPLR